jgi:hypothetical protein
MSLKGVTALRNAIVRNYDKLCCIVSNTATTNTILSSTVATEATQLSVLAAVDMMRDYETRLVIDNSDVTWLEVRYWDAQDGSLGAPVYYPPGSTVAGSPDTGGAGLTYINPNTLLALIEGELIASNAQKTATSVNTTVISNIPVGASEISIFNNGMADATVNSTPLPAGVTRTFGFKNEIDTLIVCNGNGNQILIDYMV